MVRFKNFNFDGVIKEVIVGCVKVPSKICVIAEGLNMDIHIILKKSVTKKENPNVILIVTYPQRTIELRN